MRGAAVEGQGSAQQSSLRVLKGGGGGVWGKRMSTTGLDVPRKRERERERERRGVTRAYACRDGLGLCGEENFFFLKKMKKKHVRVESVGERVARVESVRERVWRVGVVGDERVRAGTLDPQSGCVGEWVRKGGTQDGQVFLIDGRCCV